MTCQFADVLSKTTLLQCSELLVLESLVWYSMPSGPRTPHSRSLVLPLSLCLSLCLSVCLSVGLLCCLSHSVCLLYCLCLSVCLSVCHVFLVTCVLSVSPAVRVLLCLSTVELEVCGSLFFCLEVFLPCFLCAFYPL